MPNDKELLTLGIAKVSETPHLETLAGELQEYAKNDFTIKFQRSPPVFHDSRPGSKLSLGEYGCYSAQVNAIETCAQSSVDACLILERDATLVRSRELNKQIAKDITGLIGTIMDTTSEPSFGFLGYCNSNPRYRSCTHAYVLTPLRADALLKNIDPVETAAKPIDYYTAKECERLGKNCIFTSCGYVGRDDNYGFGCIRQNRDDDIFSDPIHGRKNQLLS